MSVRVARVPPQLEGVMGAAALAFSTRGLGRRV